MPVVEKYLKFGGLNGIQILWNDSCEMVCH